LQNHSAKTLNFRVAYIKVIFMKTRRFLPVIISTLLFTTFVEAATTTTDLGADSRQCVEYARSRESTLPYGLTSWQSKKDIVNSWSCTAGSVAIIDSTSIIAAGHVAVVEGCLDTKTSGAIRITETNWKKGRKTERRASSKTISGAQTELKIYGYYKKP